MASNNALKGKIRLSPTSVVQQQQQHLGEAVSLQLPTSSFHSHDSKPLPHRRESRELSPTSSAASSGSNADAESAHYILCCVPVHTFSSPVQFVLCVCGVMFFYLLYGYSQEWIFQIEDFKLFGWYFTLVQFTYYSIFGYVESQLRKETDRRIPITTYMLLAFLTVATMGLSNTSLGYLNYPTQVIFKSCKLIPVMIGGALIQAKRYSVLSVMSMLLMCVGLVLFNLADVSVKPNMDQTGIILISLALCADAVIGNVQEKAMKEHSASTVEVVFYSYCIGTVYIFMWTLFSGSLLPAFSYCWKNPRIYVMTAVFSLTGYLGINFVLVLVSSFGALTAVTVTTFRKSLTIVLSFLIFTKPFTQQYLWSGLIVLLGVVLNVYSKNNNAKQWVAMMGLRLQDLLLGKSRTHSAMLNQV